MAPRARDPEAVAHVRDIRSGRDCPSVEKELADRAKQGRVVHEGGVKCAPLGFVEAFGPGHGACLLSIGVQRGVILDASSYASRRYLTWLRLHPPVSDASLARLCQHT